MAIPDTLVPAARRFVLLAMAGVLGTSLIAGPASTNQWCGPASTLYLTVGAAPGALSRILISIALLCSTVRDSQIGRVSMVTAAAFTVAGAVYVEQAERIHHVWHLPALLLWVESTAALRTEQVRSATVGLWHAHAALSKIQAHGLGWADGASMAVWIESFAYPHARWVAAAPRWALAAGQAFALGVEAACAFAWTPRLRPFVGWALVAFYAGVLVTFPFGFVGNAALAYLYLVRSPSGQATSRRRC